ncbi:helix-turn-helix domain-containing protein [Glutamicibacter sp. MNS18]|uniref:helix-turn-helix domain-containing protein n=1 Tax=Glutamicibacter sp. MNS18 TaxID=2989817 RepID=UPI0022367578|nr:helix-turn-helix domain-containing protein [Glutamicibacter sp. MNS18]MCW4467265.1 helix-turn-helix domain-containing protein [Glutamicibacter sp. MNS18]
MTSVIFDTLLRTILNMVEVLAGYSRQAHRKMDRLSTAARALQRLKSGETRPRASTGDRHSQRYRIADRFSSEDLAVIARRYQAGEQSTDLAKEHKIAKSTLLRLLAEHGVQTRPRGLTPEKEREILRLRKQGLIIRDIAKRVGCSYDTARKFLFEQP